MSKERAASHRIGAARLRARFFALLERVERGEEVVITRHGQPIARLVPAERVDRARADAAIARLKELRAGSSLGGLSWKDLRDAGRR